MTRKKLLITWGSRALTAIAIGFMVYGIFQYDFDFAMLTSPLVVIGLLFLSTILGLGVYLFAYNFRWLTQKLSGANINKNLIIRVYCATNMYKYLPVNVMQYIGRGQIAIESKGVKQTHVALATLLENIFRGLAAVLIALFLGFNLADYVALAFPSWTVFAGAIVTVAIVVAVIVIFRRRVNVGTMAILLGNSALRAASISATFVLTLMFLGQSFTFSLMIQVAALYALAWLVSILVVIVPGGIGVREGALILMLGGLVDEPILAAGIIIHRIIYTIGDVLAWLISLKCKIDLSENLDTLKTDDGPKIEIVEEK